jgi:cytochrome P450/NADPH-cytochrome P450 reductase
MAGENIAMASTNRLSPIPHPPTKPVVGNMLSLDSNAPTQNLARLAKELGPIFWLDMMGTPLVVVSGPDLVDELSDEKRFDKAVKGSLRRVRAVAGDGLFTAYTNEPNWSKAHNILMQPFRQSRHAVLPLEHGRYRRAAGEEMGAAQRRR